MNAEHSDAWISELSTEHMTKIAKSNFALSEFDFATGSIDEIGKMAMRQVLRSDSFGAVGAKENYWEHLKFEFYLLLCTKDGKYNALRKELNSAGKKSQTAIISVIAAAMASEFGVFSGTLVPFCALFLITLSRLGKEAFCASMSEK